MNRQTISIYIAKIVADILVPILRQTTNNHTNITLTVLPPGEIKDQITYLFPNFNGAAIEVWEWISNFILLFIGHVLIYPCWVKVKPC